MENLGLLISQSIQQDSFLQHHTKMNSTLHEPDGPLVTAGSLLLQCQELYQAVQLFQSKATTQFTPVDVGSFLKSLASEIRSLERIAAANTIDQTPAPDPVYSDTEDTVRHALRSSNLSFLQTVWNLARRCRNVVALSRREKGGGGSGRKGTVVDVVSEMGLLWVKVVTLGERKLLFEIAKEGWDVGIWDDSEDGYDTKDTNGHAEYEKVAVEGEKGDTDAESILPLIGMVKGLVDAARSRKVQYRHPEVLVYLPNLQEEKIRTPAVMKVLASLRATGATILCGDTGEIKLQTFPSLTTLALEDDYGSMLPMTEPILSDVLNIDCTILLALISDLSHFHLDEKNTYNEPIKKQLHSERVRPLLPDILYPALAGRKLITSRLAALRMREIVETLGTKEEKIRADIIMKEGGFSDNNLSSTQLCGYLKERSVHRIPEDIRLPIEVIDAQQQIQNTIPASGLALLDPVLSDINKSVFLLGWCEKATTITSNRVVAKQIENVLNVAPGDVVGPGIYLIDIARSLVGKERLRRR